MWEFMGEALNPKKVTVGWKSRDSAGVGKISEKGLPMKRPAAARAGIARSPAAPTPAHARLPRQTLHNTTTHVGADTP